LASLFDLAWLTEELLLLLCLIIGQVHAAGVEPVGALITLDVEKIRVKGFFADAEGLPFFEGGFEYLLHGVVVCACEKSVGIDVVQLIVLFDGEYLARRYDAVHINTVSMVSREDFIVANVDKVFLSDAQFLKVEVFPLVIPTKKCINFGLILTTGLQSLATWGVEDFHPLRLSSQVCLPRMSYQSRGTK
jgi:hypothetical protein